MNHSHVFKQVFGSSRTRFHIDYLEPSDYFDISNFPTLNITMFILGRVCIYNVLSGDVAFGYVLHMVTERDNISQYRTKYWIGQFESLSSGIIPKCCFHSLTNTSLFRRMEFPTKRIEYLYNYIAEMAACLDVILPTLYKTEMARLQGEKARPTERWNPNATRGASSTSSGNASIRNKASQRQPFSPTNNNNQSSHMIQPKSTSLSSNTPFQTNKSKSNNSSNEYKQDVSHRASQNQSYTSTNQTSIITDVIPEDTEVSNEDSKNDSFAL